MRVLLATDLPFWDRKDGAQQRISQLFRQLQNWSEATQVFYIGPQRSDSSRDLAPKGIDIVVGTSTRPPKALPAKLKWYWEAVWNQLGYRSEVAVGRAGLQLSDFTWPWAVQQFVECVRDFRPDVVVIEYIKLAYLIDGLTRKERNQIRVSVDSHDILHRRCQQFQERGLPHWIEITEAEELAAASKFDSVLAIQPNEAKYFREHLKARGCETEVIVAGFAASDVLLNPRRKFLNSQQPTFGYIGSRNPSNVDACEWLLESLWPQVLQNCPAARLILGGSVCQYLSLPNSLEASVELAGFVENVESFYEKIDFCWNPVRFGTGLKIKNVEALSFGKPLLTTGGGRAGLDFPDQKAIFSSDAESALVHQAVEWAHGAEQYGELVDSAVFLAGHELSEGRVYSDLRKWLEAYNR